MADASAKRDPPPRRTLLQNLLNDRLLLSAFVCCGLLIGYQLTVTLLQPPWLKPVTDWLRTALAWPQLLVVAWLAVRLEPCNLAGVVGEAVAEQLALNPERSILWVAEASPVLVFADASHIEQVVANYVSNALKFSRADQIVEVRLRREERMARVSVHDEGIGIPLADQPHIWERFYQAAEAHVQSGSQIGFGIGLYISKAIIEGHQGQVGVESAPGQGTTIWFTLPLAK